MQKRTPGRQKKYRAGQKRLAPIIGGKQRVAERTRLEGIAWNRSGREHEDSVDREIVEQRISCRALTALTFLRESQLRFASSTG